MPSNAVVCRNAMDTADRLNSWKDIATYLGRDVTTVQRWEKREQMPVHRHQHDRMGSVYAFRSELDAGPRSPASDLAGERGLAASARQAEAGVGLHCRGDGGCARDRRSDVAASD